MAVVSGYPKELIEKRSSQTDAEGSRYFRHFIVKVSAVTDTPYIAESATGIPRVGDDHPDNGYATCRVVRCEPYQGLSETYEVMVEYSTPLSNLPGGDNADPLLRSAQYGGGSEKVTVPLSRAVYAGKKLYKRNGTVDVQLIPGITSATPPIMVTNSAGQPFINVPEFEETMPYVRIQRNEAPNIGAIVQKQTQYEGKVNSDTFSIGTLTVLPGLAKIADISWTREVDNQIPYFDVTYTIMLREAGWDYEIQDEGVVELTTTEVAKIQNIKDENNEDISQPVLLNGFGKRCRSSTPAPLATDTVSASLLYRKSNGTIPFAPLGLF